MVHDLANVGASIASGLLCCARHGGGALLHAHAAAVAHGLADNLLTRAADVVPGL